jgi:hypothetical protein
MKPLEQDELFQHLKGFLKSKGVELQEGSYAGGIRKSCSLLSDAINLGQEGLGRAKVKIDERLDQMRQVIHEKTAPGKSSPPPAAPPQGPGPKVKTQAKSSAAKAPRRRKPKTSKSR